MSNAVKLEPIKSQLVELRIVGTSPYISHAWSEKALKMIREKQAGKKTKARDVREPEAEAMAAAYYTEDGEYGIPAMAIKAAMIGAAHKDLGIEKTLVKKALFLRCDDANMVLPIAYEKMVIREDQVRVGQGSADLRYRPEFRGWSAVVVFEVDTALLTDADLVNLLNRAGFGVGIGEWRPEKGGEFGRFSVGAVEEAARKAA